MFLEKLSESLLRICAERDLTYETAAELCEFSSRFFGKVVRRESSPNLESLERFCLAFDRTPNELLGYGDLDEQLRFRIAKPITKRYCFHLDNALAIYAVCPQCAHIITQDYQNYCGNCGQMLSWGEWENSEIVELT